MPRAPRCHVPGDLYHVIARGNHQETVFRYEGDFAHYSRLLDRYSLRYDVKIHAYALMPNHIHLLVEEGSHPLGRFMKGVQQSHAQYVNTRYEQSGHLFQGRYKAIRLDRDEYLLALVRYIHLNPVRAGLAKEPLDYRWSSHRHYFSGVGEGKVETALVTGVLAQSGGKEIADYELLSTKPTKELTPNREMNRPVASATVAVNEPIPLTTVLQRVSEFTRVPTDQIVGRPRDAATTAARWLFIFISARDGHCLREIARFLGRAASGVTVVVKMVERDIEEGGQWQARLRAFQEGN